MFVIRSFFVAAVLLFPPLLQAQTLQLTAVNPKPDRPCLYVLKFQLPRQIPPRAAVEVTFPAGYNVSGVKIAGSNELAGGIRFVADSLRVRLERTGLGPALPAGKTAQIIFGPVRRPKNRSAATDSAVVNIFYNGAGNQFQHQAFQIDIR